MTAFESHCARCLRPAPDQESDEFATWEVVFRDDDVNFDHLVVICEDCLTPEEQQAIFEDMEETARRATDGR